MPLHVILEPMASECAVLAEVITMPSALRGSSQLPPCMCTRIHPCGAAIVSTHLHRPNSLLCVCILCNTNIIACSPPSTQVYPGMGGYSYHSSLTNPLVVSQTCVLCFNRGENKHIVEQGFGTAQVCCWIWGHSITARTSQRRLGLGCNHREGKERTLSCAIAINNPHTGIINHQ